MATTSNRLTDLYREALESVTATPENWLRFLQSAGRNYRYPFQDQLLIHYQRPDAIAVLEFSQWERRFHRGIRRGSTGIAVFGRSNGRTQVRYLFDIQDTNERASSILVPLWNVESGDHGPLLHMLEQKFNATEPVLPIAVMTAAKQYSSAVVSLRWEELQKAQVPVTQDALERLVENSVAYLLLCRMGLEDYAIFYPQDFDALEQFRTPQNAAVDNMLKITSDGRKLALDQRLMNPMLPDDEHSKTTACAKNVYDIWEKTADQRGTQIVFCDLSTPHFDGSFNVYDDLRSKLTEMGIPKEEIAFIHEAPTDAKKKKLFQEVRSGQVRVLIGSTSKMGTGTNVQTRLAALHDIDCPWRPSDLEQRSGRIIRQGNLNDQVDIYRYVTKETFDSYNWVRREVA